MIVTGEGIDVSHWQGRICKSDLRSINVAFVYAKATQGRTGIDPEFYRTAKLCRQLEIPFGAYHYFEPRQDAKAQAEWFLSVTRNHCSLPAMLDFETLNGAESPGHAVFNAMQWLLDVDEVTRQRSIVYSYDHFLRLLPGHTLGRWPLALADYRKRLPIAPKPWIAWSLWQYDGDGGKRLPSGVDCDFMRGTIDAGAKEPIRGSLRY